MPDFLKLAKEAYEASTTYIDANYRKDWDFSIKAFRNEHSSDSKYSQPDYAHRSRLFRPKARSVMRKNEAAGAVALFSNMDVINTQPVNPDSVINVAMADCMKYLIEYRLTHSIPAFPLVMGGIQDAQKQGVVCSYNYWKYQNNNGRKVFDKPCIELRPVENLRFDPGADWMDVVGTTPYFCDIVPMYVCDVKAMMDSVDDKTNQPKWKKYEDAVIQRARPDEMDSTRQARQGNRQDPLMEKKNETLKSFDIVWVLRWFMRDSQGQDHTFYTLGQEELLTQAKPIDEVYFHGMRPYTLGYAILETHAPLKSTMPVMLKPLIHETNEIANQRLDNVKFVLNKRWLVARGRQVDVQSLVRNVPGGVTLMNDPKNDIVESNWADVTSSSYVEQDRLNADFDDLAGNFSPNTKFANKGMNDTLGGSRMAAQGAGIMTDYLLRTIIETWWEPTLRQLVLLESYYETDSNVLAVCAQKARLFPKYGFAAVTDDMLMNEVIVSVNVGMGASNPNERFQKFMMATQAAIQLVAQAPPGFNVKEGIKEIYSNAGYRDGSRFFNEQIDPRMQKLMQMVQQAQQVIEGKKIEQQAQMQLESAKIQSSERIQGAKILVDKTRVDGDLRIREAELALEKAKIDLELLKLQIEVQDVATEHNLRSVEINADIESAQLKLEGERQKLEGQAMKLAAEIEKAQMELATVRKEGANEEKIGQVAEGVTKSVGEITGEILQIKQALQTHAGGIGDITKGLGAMIGVMMQPKKKPKGFIMKKDGKKTVGVLAQFDDGSTEEIAVS